MNGKAYKTFEDTMRYCKFFSLGICITRMNCITMASIHWAGQNIPTKTAFTRCRHILKTVKNVTVAEFELAFTRCRNNLKTVGNLTVRISLQDSDAIKRYLHPNCRSVLFQKRRKLFYFHHFQVFTQCHFQNVPVRVQFSKSTVFKICRRKMCRFRVNGRPIRHFFIVFKMCRHRVNAV